MSIEALYPPFLLELTSTGQEATKILAEFVQSPSTASPENTAEEMHKLYFERDMQYRASMRIEVFGFWVIVLDLVGQLPLGPTGALAQGLLADLSGGLQALDYITETGSVIQPWAIPDLLEEIVISCLFRSPIHYSSEEDMLINQGYYNIVSFAARLTGQSIRDFSLAALMALRDALEYLPNPDPLSRAWQNRYWRYDIYVPIAAIWIEFAGRVLFRSDQVWPSDVARGGNLWSGSRGFSVERWALWRRRFSEISMFEQAKLETRELARGAEVMMARVEGEAMVAELRQGLEEGMQIHSLNAE